MADERVRELERRWRETGSIEDAAGLLRERIRVGDLTPERCELAAVCGDPGARLLHAQPEGETVKAFVTRVIRLGGREAILRALAAAGHALARSLPERDRSTAEGAMAALRALEAWVLRPDPRRRKALLKAGRGVDRFARGQGILTALDQLAFRAVEALLSGNETELCIHARNGLGGAWFLEDTGVIPAGLVSSAIEAEVAPWALGTGDPLEARALR